MRTPLTAAVVLMMFCGPGTAQPAAPNEPTLTVHGEGRVQVPPDHADLTVEVVTKGTSLDAATAAHRERASRAVTALRAMKNDGLKIERSVFRLNEIRPSRRPSTAPGQDEPEYHAITTFELKLTHMDAVDSAVTAIAATGLFEVRNLRFGIEEQNPGLKAARRKAVEDARERATTYAQAAGVRLGDVVKIEDTGLRSPRQFAVSASMVRNVQVIPPETLTLTAAVTMTWRIERKH